MSINGGIRVTTGRTGNNLHAQGAAELHLEKTKDGKNPFEFDGNNK